jgi:hypothetical protein
VSGAALERPAAATLLCIAIALFIVSASRLVAVPGLQYDEVLFVNAALGEPAQGLFVAKRLLGVPVMLMGYVGALKAYLYFPIFQAFGVSPATIRWPVILLSALTLGLAYEVARCSFGRVISAMFVLVIAADPVFVSLTTLDVGPVALMLFLKLAALLCALRAVTTGRPGYLWGVTIACALGIFDKLNFIWFVLALALAAGLLFRAELVAILRRDRAGFLLPVFALGIVTAVATFGLILPQLIASQAQQSGVGAVDRLRYVLGLYARTMEGREFYHLVTKSVLNAHSPVNVLTALGTLGLGTLTLARAGRSVGLRPGVLSDRIVAGHLLLFVLIGLQLLITKKAWGPHHVMMLYPFHLLVVLAAAARMAGSVGAVVTAGVLTVSGLHVGSAYARRFQPTAEFEAQWSPVIGDLVHWLDERGPDRIASVDWGTHNQIVALGSPHTRAAGRDLWPYFRGPGESEAHRLLFEREFQGRDVLAVLFGPQWDIMPQVRSGCNAWAAGVGLRPRRVREFRNPNGTVIYEVYAIEDSLFPRADR